MKKILFLIIPLIILGFFWAKETRAGAADNVSGWAWSENVGWISFNNTTGGGATNYGVNINSDGTFSGYGWSGNIGWVHFAPAGPYPALPNYSAKADLATGEVSGWARALAYGDDWDGWIKLRNTNYGVSINRTTGGFSGWVWSDMVIGWISFKGTNYGVTTTFSFNRPPNKPGIPPEYPEGESWNHCGIQELSVPTFHWTYSDPDGDLQSAYEIRIDDDSDFSVQEPGEFTASGGAATAYSPIPSSWASWMHWNTNYWWIVRVKDDKGNWSVWSDPNPFTTPLHAYPWVDFTWSPPAPNQGEIVSFNPDSTQAYGGATISSYLWTITQGEGRFVGNTNNTSRYPKIIFSTSDNKVKLKITDSSGYWCEKEKIITTKLPLPEFREVPPIIWLQKIFAGMVNFLDGFLKF